MPPPDPISILLVDDEPRTLTALEAALSSVDYCVVKANSGPEALKCVLAQDFAVILLDVRMRQMDGFETAVLIRARERSHSTPIIFLTAFDHDGARTIEGYRRGAVDYLNKPFDAEVLRSKVAVFVDLFQKTAALEQRMAQLASVTADLVTRERQVVALNDELVERVIERTAANAELESFSYSVSHDLRAPLRAITGFSRILLEQHAARLGPELQGYIELVRENADQMEKLIEALLGLSHVSHQDLAKSQVLTADIVRDVLDELAPARDAMHVEIAVGVLMPCWADRALLKQVFLNLIGNALKFTRHRLVGHIEIGCVEADGDVVYFVKDDGTGFDMRYAEKLFGAFQRMHRAQDYEGTGVGLSIVKRIVERHGGRVWADAALDKGATFSFTLAGGRASRDDGAATRNAA